MHFKVIGSLALAALSSLVSAKCHQSGEVSTQQDVDALFMENDQRLRLICSQMTIRPFRSGQTSDQCLLASNGQRKWQFFVARTSNSPDYMWLRMDECVTALRDEVRGCSRGGVKAYTNFKFGYVFHRASPVRCLVL